MPIISIQKKTLEYISKKKKKRINIIVRIMLRDKKKLKDLCGDAFISKEKLNVSPKRQIKRSLQIWGEEKGKKYFTVHIVLRKKRKKKYTEMHLFLG